MLPNRLFLYILLTVCLLLNNANAALVEGLYEAKVAIDDQSLASQRKAMRNALKNVLVKVSGNKSLLEHQLIREKVQKAQDYMRAYQFESVDGELMYHAEFDKQRVQKMILDAGFPIWDSRRPDSLLWLAIETPDIKQRLLLSEFSDSPVLESAREVAKSRGIPVGFPVLDLTERQQVTLYDVWGQFSNVITQASSRYGVEYVLSARIFLHHFESPFEQELDIEVAPSWVADYVLIHKDTLVSDSLYGASPESLSAELVTLLADLLADKYAINFSGFSENDASVELVVTNVTTLAQYTEVYDFLSSLSVVANATLVNQNGQFSTFSLNLLGDTQDLLNALRLDDKIRPTLDEFGQENQNLHFLWVP